MSDDTSAQPTVAQPTETASAENVDNNSAPEPVAPVVDAKSSESDEPDVASDGDKVDESKKEEDSDSKPELDPTVTTGKESASTDTSDKATEGDVDMEDKPAPEDVADSEMIDAAEDANNDPVTPVPSRSQARRKSTATTDKGKKLNRKASKARILHLDAKPGDHFFAKLKGFPPWPVVICEEDMLPQNMLSSRPVTAARPDGTYRDDFADGGKRVADRTFPVMYLHTNEFSWTPNYDLNELDAATVGGMVTPKMRKDLQAAHVLASEGHDLDYYKNVLREFEEQRLAKLEAKKTKVKTPKKSSKATDEEGDLEMDDIEDEAGEPSEKKPKSKKRKAEDETSTPQRPDSVKKPKIKLTGTSTPKATNGAQSAPAKDAAKATKSKAKSSKGTKEADSKKEKEVVAPKEPELTLEEKLARKEKEILFLRHRLQRGLLPRVGSPVPDEMKQVSDFLAKLETFPDLDVSIIRATKINKVLKAILKKDSIPRAEEFQFKPRSQSLLDKWNILLASDTAPVPAAGSSVANTNGVNGSSKTTGADVKPEAENNAPEAKDEDEDPAEGKDEPAKEVTEETSESAAADTATAVA